MERVEKAIAALPLRPDVVQKAFERFRDTGELPEQQRLAAAVTEQALRGGREAEPGAPPSYVLSRLEQIIVIGEQRARGKEPKPPLPRFASACSTRRSTDRTSSGRRPGRR